MWGFGKKSNQVLHFWVLAVDAHGDDVINGPFASTQQARQESGDLQGVRIFKLYTRDPDAAKRKIKSMKLRDTGRHQTAMQPIRSGQTATAPVDEPPQENKRSFFEPEGEDIRNA